jgi:hypothetical protein
MLKPMNHGRAAPLAQAVYGTWPCSISMPSLPLRVPSLAAKAYHCRLSHPHAVHGDAPRAGSATLVLTPYSRCAHDAPRAGNARALRRPQPRAPGLGAGARLLANAAPLLNIAIDACTAYTALIACTAYIALIVFTAYITVIAVQPQSDTSAIHMSLIRPDLTDGVTPRVRQTRNCGQWLGIVL